MTYKISYKEQCSVEEENALLDGLAQEAKLAKGLDRATPFSFFIKNEEEEVLGGVIGVTYYGCLYIDSLWLQKELRNQGFGTQLMKAVEKLGRERHSTFITVTTMDWEALSFYQKLGYEIEYVREGYEKSSKMYILKKSL